MAENGNKDIHFNVDTEEQDYFVTSFAQPRPARVPEGLAFNSDV